MGNIRAEFRPEVQRGSDTAHLRFQKLLPTFLYPQGLILSQTLPAVSEIFWNICLHLGSGTVQRSPAPCFVSMLHSRRGRAEGPGLLFPVGEEEKGSFTFLLDYICFRQLWLRVLMIEKQESEDASFPFDNVSVRVTSFSW